jgi:hypothetical protein
MELCRGLSRGARPVFIPITPTPDAEPNDCFPTVRRKVSAEDGSIRFIWAFWGCPNIYIEAENPAVYSAGSPWADVVPSSNPGATHRLFLPGDVASYDFDGVGVRRD